MFYIHSLEQLDKLDDNNLVYCRSCKHGLLGIISLSVLSSSGHKTTKKDKHNKKSHPSGYKTDVGVFAEKL